MLDPSWLGAGLVLVLVLWSSGIRRTNPLRMLSDSFGDAGKYDWNDVGPATTLVRRTQSISKFLSLRAFPLGLFISKDMEQQVRDGIVDQYVIIWTIALAIGGSITFLLQKSDPAEGVWVAKFLAWIAAYRTIEIVVSRIYILTTFAGVPPFGLNRARRSMILSILDVGQVIMAFAFMFQGWTADQWKPHQLLGFAYISMRVIFTLGPPEEPMNTGARALIGTELMAGLVVIALGVAGYLSALRDHQPERRKDRVGLLRRLEDLQADGLLSKDEVEAYKLRLPPN